MHTYFDVAHHPAFMNQANQTSIKFTYIHTKPFSQDNLVSLQQAHRRPEARTQFRKRMLRVCTCPHCGLYGSRASLIQSHFDACAQNPNWVIRPIPKQLIERHKTIQSIASRACICPYCNKKGTWLINGILKSVDINQATTTEILLIYNESRFYPNVLVSNIFQRENILSEINVYRIYIQNSK